VPIYIPPVDIFESATELVLLADMPGVAIDNVDIDLDNDQLTIRGPSRWRMTRERSCSENTQ